MKKLLGILVLGLVWCNVGVANDLPKLFGITISDKIYNYKTADKPHTEDKFLVQIFPPVQNDDFDFYVIKFDNRGRIYHITGVHKKSTKWIAPTDANNITKADIMIHERQNKKCTETAKEHANVVASNKKFNKYYKTDPVDESLDSAFYTFTFSKSKDINDYGAWKYLVGVHCKRYTDGLRAELFIIDIELDNKFKEFEKKSIDKKGLSD
tara:strand:+ start:137 stop:766 length:630 start_codon:yes stop_codon:yes gene_type:complete